MSTAASSPTWMRWNLSSVASAIFIGWITGLAITCHQLTIAVWALSFWHYCLYALAYGYRAVPLSQFKLDAMMMKAAALFVLAFVYLPSLSSFVSLAVVCCGFLLNASAARQLGASRTYYGHEIADLPFKRVTAFPYSAINHPMLAGNVLSFAGLLLDPAFRERWWLLALVHIVFNAGLFAMETAKERSEMSFRHVDVASHAVAIGAVAIAFVSLPFAVASPSIAVLANAGVVAYALVLVRSYRPRKPEAMIT